MATVKERTARKQEMSIEGRLRGLSKHFGGGEVSVTLTANGFRVVIHPTAEQARSSAIEKLRQAYADGSVTLAEFNAAIEKETATILRRGHGKTIHEAIDKLIDAK